MSPDALILDVVVFALGALATLAAAGPIRTVARRAGHRRLVWGGAVAATALWLPLVAWFPLGSYGTVPYNGFDKVPGHFANPILWGTTLAFGGLAAGYGLGFAMIRRASAATRPLKAAILGIVGLGGAVNLLVFPAGALDVFNYLATLRVAYGYARNPYLVSLASLGADPFSKDTFTAGPALFYGPTWLVFSALPALVGGSDPLRMLLAEKALNLALILATGYLLARARLTPRGRWEAFYLYCANPLVLFEGVGNGHNDAMMTAFLVAAVLAARNQSWAVGPALAASVGVKFFTAPLAAPLALLAWRGRWPARTVAGAIGGALLLTAATALPWWAAGARPSTLWKNATGSQQMAAASLLSLAEQSAHHPYRAPFGVLFVVGILALSWRMAWPDRLEQTCVRILMLFLILISLMYGWYLLPIIALIAMRPDRAGLGYLFVATTLGLLYHPLSVWAWFNSGLDGLQIHLVQAALLTAPICAYLGWVGLVATRRALSRPAVPPAAPAACEAGRVRIPDESRTGSMAVTAGCGRARDHLA